MVVENGMFWSEIGLEFGELGGTHLPRKEFRGVTPWVKALLILKYF